MIDKKITLYKWMALAALLSIILVGISPLKNIIYDLTDPQQMNANIKNIESEHLKTLWGSHDGYSISADAFNTGSAGILTVSCDAFKKDGGALVAHRELAFHMERNSETPFICKLKKDTLPEGDYVFNVSVAEEMIDS